MASSYPAGLDAFTAIGAADEMDDSVGGRTHRAMHNDANDAVEAIEAELGLDPAGASATVVARLDALDTTAAGAALKSANLTDLADAAAARTALGLGTMATATSADYAALSGGVFTGAVRIDGSANTYQLRVQGHSTQTVQLQTWENSGGSLLAAALSSGSLVASYFSNTTDNGPRFAMSATGVDLVNRGTASNVVLAVSGMAAQSGNLSEWRSSADVVQASISAAGALTANGVTVPAGYDLDVQHAAAGNVRYGPGTIPAIATGTNNITLGNQAGNRISTGSYNTLIGAQAGFLSTTPSYTVSIGNGAGRAGGSASVGVGTSAAYSNTGGSVVAVGVDALKNSTTGSNLIGLGRYAGKYTTTQSNEIFLNSLDRSDRAGDIAESIIYGVQNATASAQTLALNAAVTATYGLTATPTSAAGVPVTAKGAASQTADLFRATNSADVVQASISAAGALTANGVTVAAGYDINAAHAAAGSTRYGAGALNPSATGSGNTGIGNNSLASVTTGLGCTATGYYASAGVNVARYVTSVGYSANRLNTSGYGNVSVGYAAGYSATGGNNTSIGYLSMYLQAAGTDGIALGAYSGRYAVAEDGALYINSLDRTDTAGDKSSSIIYGVQNATASAQTLALNAKVSTTYKLTTAASTTAEAGVNLPDGAAPTSPVDGDMWQDGTDLKIRINGVTKTVTLT